MNFLTIFNGMKHSILLALTLQASLIADQVTTTDGSVLVGQILGMQDGNLTIKTEFAGKLRIAHPQIATISSEDSFSIRLEDNRTYNGVIVSREDRTLGLEERATNFELKEIRQLWPDGEDDPLILSAQKRPKDYYCSGSMPWDSIWRDLPETPMILVCIRLDSTLANKMREYDFYLSYNNSTKKNVTTVDETKFGAEYDSGFRGIGLVRKNRFRKRPARRY